MRFTNLPKSKVRQVIIDFPYDDQEVKVCLKVPPVIEDLSVAIKAREYATEVGVKDPTEKHPEYNIRSMAEVVFNVTYECTKSGDEWKETTNKFFSSVDEIIDNVDQDLLLYLYEYYQSFRSITKKNESFTAENVAVITHVMGGDGSQEDKLNFFCTLPRFAQFNYILFTAKLARISLLTKSEPGSNCSVEQTINIPD